MNDILNKILQTKFEEVAVAKLSEPLSLVEQAITTQSPTRGFANAIIAKVVSKQSAVIAEIKKASPSKGVIRDHFVPADIAKSYEDAGAVSLSVLTDVRYFQGHSDYLKQARAACKLPVLRKDFIVDEYQIYEARAMGADAILLIAAALDLPQMIAFEQLASELKMDVLVEVHNSVELEVALQLKTRLLGINNRNLKTFEVTLQNTFDLLSSIPAGKCIVTESGIMNGIDVQQMKQHGVHAFLVGEAFMRTPEPGLALKEMFKF
jgi:indole-3-glycerol phosphate synthase